MKIKIFASISCLLLILTTSYASASLTKEKYKEGLVVNNNWLLVGENSSTLANKLAFNYTMAAVNQPPSSRNSNAVVTAANTAEDSSNAANNATTNKNTSNNNNSSPALKTVLNDDTVNNLDDYSKAQLLRKEIQGLNQELDSLNTKVDSLEKENTQLKLDLQKYGDEEKRKLQKDEQIEALSDEARAVKASLGDRNVPDSYISAQNLLIIGNIDLAEQQLQAFIANISSDKRSSEYLGSTNSTGFFIAYANYWLGRINNINGNYKKAAEYFSESYKITNYSNLSLMSLVGLIESLTRLTKDTEACTAIKQFQQDYSKAASSKGFSFNSRYLKMVENFRTINRCQ